MTGRILVTYDLGEPKAPKFGCHIRTFTQKPKLLLIGQQRQVGIAGN